MVAYNKSWLKETFIVQMQNYHNNQKLIHPRKESVMMKMMIFSMMKMMNIEENQHEQEDLYQGFSRLLLLY